MTLEEAEDVVRRLRALGWEPRVTDAGAHWLEEVGQTIDGKPQPAQQLSHNLREAWLADPAAIADYIDLEREQRHEQRSVEAVIDREDEMIQRFRDELEGLDDD
jgi:hypothetical protein